MKKIALLILLTLINTAALAKPQTVTLALPTMNCAMCPITVKKALHKVEGVASAEVSLETKQAVVTFEDTLTTTDALVQATTNAGFRSTVLQ